MLYLIYKVKQQVGSISTNTTYLQPQAMRTDRWNVHRIHMHFYLHEFRLCLQNLLEKSAERESRQEYALAMIQCKVLKQLENLDQQKYDDEDITDDIKFLLERLGESVQDLRCSLTEASIINSTLICMAVPEIYVA